MAEPARGHPPVEPHSGARCAQAWNAESAPTIHLKHLIAFTAIVNDPNIIKPFLAANGHSPTEVEKMHEAWSKSLWLQIALWTEPFTNAQVAPNEW